MSLRRKKLNFGLVIASLCFTPATQAHDIRLVYQVQVTAKVQGQTSTTSWTASDSERLRIDKQWSTPYLAPYAAFVYQREITDYAVSGGGTYVDRSGTQSWTYGPPLLPMPDAPGAAFIFYPAAINGVYGTVEGPFIGDGADHKVIGNGGFDRTTLSQYMAQAHDQAQKDLKKLDFWSLTDATHGPDGYHNKYSPSPIVTTKAPSAGSSEKAEVSISIEYYLYVDQVPSAQPTLPDEEMDQKCEDSGSIIGCRDQSLGEEVGVAGVPFSLRYQSERMPGRLGSAASWTARDWNLGGWSISVQHAWDPAAKILYLGNGSRRSGTDVKPVSISGGFVIPGQAENLIYQFDSSGRHQRTIDPFTGAAVYEFGYDSLGRLTSVKDGSGNVATIERDGAQPTAIVGPYGHRTSLTVDANGYLSQIRGPDDAVIGAVYDGNGLMQSITDPRGNIHYFQYDQTGRLVRDQDPAGGSRTLTNLGAASGSVVRISSASGRNTTYSTTLDSSGVPSSSTQFPDGTASALRGSSAFPQSVLSTSGLLASFRDYAPDPSWGQQSAVPGNLTLSTPGGAPYNITFDRAAELADPSDPLSLSALHETLAVNGRQYRSDYSAASRTLTRTSPAGKVTTLRFDSLGRVVERRQDGFATVQYANDSHGRLMAVTAGTGEEARTRQYEYGADGMPSRVTDSLGGSATLAYDQAQRPVRFTRPDGETVGFTYNANGDMTSVTPPGRSAHTLQYTPLNMVSVYQAPGDAAGMMWSWNSDRELSAVTYPDGSVVKRNYDVGGRLISLEFPSGKLDYRYDNNTGLLTGISDIDGNSIVYSYDGPLVVAQTWSGVVGGSLQRTYDADFSIAAISVSGGARVSFGYDDDGLLIGAGDMVLTRDTVSGLLSATTLDQLSDTRTFNQFGELTAYTALGPSGVLFSAQYQRDKGGRLIANTETVDGATTVYQYGYDAAGRLATVDKDGAALARYSYDANGNRGQVVDSSGSVDAFYDEQDRLLQQGAAAYSYTANGQLARKSAGEQTTQYSYDVLGNLRRVVLPDGREIQYIVDGHHRRIGKLVGGMLTQGFLWQDLLRPVAELDGSGNIVSTFIYATNSGAPAYIVKDGLRYRLFTDQTGSPRIVVNAATGEVAQRIDYDPFGKVILDSNPGFQPFGFAGGLYDPDTGLVRFFARDYDSEAGRWTAKDPASLGGGDANLYVYCRNDPLNRLDPSGLDPVSTKYLATNTTQDSDFKDLIDDVTTAIEVLDLLVCPLTTLAEVEVYTTVKDKLLSPEAEQSQLQEKVVEPGAEGTWDLAQWVKSLWKGASDAIGDPTCGGDQSAKDGSKPAKKPKRTEKPDSTATGRHFHSPSFYDHDTDRGHYNNLTLPAAK